MGFRASYLKYCGPQEGVGLLCIGGYGFTNTILHNAIILVSVVFYCSFFHSVLIVPELKFNSIRQTWHFPQSVGPKDLPTSTSSLLEVPFTTLLRKNLSPLY